MKQIVVGLVLYVSLVVVAPLNAGASIALSVSPNVATARGNAQLRILVERNADNRQLMWEIDGANYYRSSTMDMHGASSPRSWFFFVRDLPAGSFDVRAKVKRNNDSVSVAIAQLTVMPGSRSR